MSDAQTDLKGKSLYAISDPSLLLYLPATNLRRMLIENPGMQSFCDALWTPNAIGQFSTQLWL